MQLPFTHPWILAALAAVLLPILIEWLFRRRRRRVELPTIRFLLRNKEQKKVKRQDRILLAVRMLGVLCLVLAVARPHDPARADRRREPQACRSAARRDGEHESAGRRDDGLFTGSEKSIGDGAGMPAGAAGKRCASGDKAETVLERGTDAQTAAARIDSLRCGSGARADGSGFGGDARSAGQRQGRTG